MEKHTNQIMIYYMVAVNELNRKILHLFFGLVPIILWFVDDKNTFFYTFLFSITTIILDFTAKFFAPLYIKKFLYREQELTNKKKFSGAFWMSISCVILVLFFNKNDYIPAMLAVSICDTFAALIGQRYGKHKIFNSNKTIEGFVAFLMSGIIVYIIIYILGIHIYYIYFIFALFISGLCELIDFIDDNLSIMISFALILSLFVKV